MPIGRESHRSLAELSKSNRTRHGSERNCPGHSFLPSARPFGPEQFSSTSVDSDLHSRRPQRLRHNVRRPRPSHSPPSRAQTTAARGRGFGKKKGGAAPAARAPPPPPAASSRFQNTSAARSAAPVGASAPVPQHASSAAPPAAAAAAPQGMGMMGTMVTRRHMPAATPSRHTQHPQPSRHTPARCPA